MVLFTVKETYASFGKPGFVSIMRFTSLSSFVWYKILISDSWRYQTWSSLFPREFPERDMFMICRQGKEEFESRPVETL